MYRAIQVAAVIPLAACANSPVLFGDSIDLYFDFGLNNQNDAGLHAPYVQGSSFSLWVTHRKDRNISDWSIVNEDEDIFSLRCEAMDEEEYVIYCEAQATAAGNASIVVVDGRGKEIGRTTVEVALPDEIVLLPHGPLIVDREDLIDGTHQVLAGGTSTWLARYYRDGQQLHGHNTLSVDSSSGFDAWTERTFLFEDRDWLQGTALEPGAHDLELLVDGVPVDTVTFSAVGPEQIDRVELYGMSEADAALEASLVVLAQAYDSIDVPVYGAAFSWNIDGYEESEAGDLFRYSYDPDDETLVSVSYDGLGTEVLVHGTGYVDSTNNLGCSSLSGAAGGLAGLLVGLLGIARRREG